MRTIAIILLLLSTVARADEVSIKLDDGSQKAISQLPALLDQCVSGVMVHGEPSACRALSQVLTALNGTVKTAQTESAKPAPAQSAE